MKMANWGNPYFLINGCVIKSGQSWIFFANQCRWQTQSGAVFLLETLNYFKPFCIYFTFLPLSHCSYSRGVHGHLNSPKDSINHSNSWKTLWSLTVLTWSTPKSDTGQAGTSCGQVASGWWEFFKVWEFLFVRTEEWILSPKVHLISFIPEKKREFWEFGKWGGGGPLFPKVNVKTLAKF